MSKSKKVKKYKRVKKFKKVRKIKKLKRRVRIVVLKKTKKLKKYSKSRESSKKGVITEEAVLALVEKGRHRGFVTQAEIINHFPGLEKDIAGLEMLYDRLESANINIIESSRVFEEDKVREYDEKKKIELEFEGGSVSDSVQMYLQKICRPVSEFNLARFNTGRKYWFI